MKRILYILIILSLVTGACSSLNKSKKSDSLKQEQPDEIVQKNGVVVNATARLSDQTTWVLRSMKAKHVAYAKGQRPATLHFNPEAGLVSGSTGVNRFSAGYVVSTIDDGIAPDNESHGSLTFGEIICTKIAGPDDFMTLESSYLSLLRKVDGFQVGEYELKLMQGDNVILSFEKSNE